MIVVPLFIKIAKQPGLPKFLDHNKPRTRRKRLFSFKFLLLWILLALDHLRESLSGTPTTYTTGLLGIGVLADVVFVSSVVEVTETVPPGGGLLLTRTTNSEVTATKGSVTRREPTLSSTSNQQISGSGTPETKVVGSTDIAFERSAGSTSSTTATSVLVAATPSTPESSTLTAVSSQSSTATVTQAHRSISTSVANLSPPATATASPEKKLSSSATAAISCSAIVLIAILSFGIYLFLRRQGPLKSAGMCCFSTESQPRSNRRSTLTSFSASKNDGSPPPRPVTKPYTTVQNQLCNSNKVPIPKHLYGHHQAPKLDVVNHLGVHPIQFPENELQQAMKFHKSYIVPQRKPVPNHHRPVQPIPLPETSIQKSYIVPERKADPGAMYSSSNNVRFPDFGGSEETLLPYVSDDGPPSPLNPGLLFDDTRPPSPVSPLNEEFTTPYDAGHQRNDQRTRHSSASSSVYSGATSAWMNDYYGTNSPPQPPCQDVSARKLATVHDGHGDRLWPQQTSYLDSWPRMSNRQKQSGNGNWL